MDRSPTLGGGSAFEAGPFAAASSGHAAPRLRSSPSQAPLPVPLVEAVAAVCPVDDDLVYLARPIFVADAPPPLEAVSRAEAAAPAMFGVVPTAHTPSSPAGSERPDAGTDASTHATQDDDPYADVPVVPMRFKTRRWWPTRRDGAGTVRPREEGVGKSRRAAATTGKSRSWAPLLDGAGGDRHPTLVVVPVDCRRMLVSCSGRPRPATTTTAAAAAQPSSPLAARVKEVLHCRDGADDSDRGIFLAEADLGDARAAAGARPRRRRVSQQLPFDSFGGFVRDYTSPCTAYAGALMMELWAEKRRRYQVEFSQDGQPSAVAETVLRRRSDAGESPPPTGGPPEADGEESPAPARPLFTDPPTPIGAPAEAAVADAGRDAEGEEGEVDAGPTEASPSPSPNTRRAAREALWEEEVQVEAAFEGRWLHRFLVTDSESHALWALQVGAAPQAAHDDGNDDDLGSVRVVPPSEFFDAVTADSVAPSRGPGVSAFTEGGRAPSTDGRDVRSRTRSPASAAAQEAEAVPLPLVGGARGFVDGHFSVARFNTPTALCWRLEDAAATGEATGEAGHSLPPPCSVLFVSDSGNHAIRCVDFSTRMVRTVAGMDGAPGYRDGSCASSLLWEATAMAWCSSGLLFCDGPNSALRLVTGLAQSKSTEAAGTASRPPREDAIVAEAADGAAHDSATELPEDAASAADKGVPGAEEDDDDDDDDGPAGFAADVPSVWTVAGAQPMRPARQQRSPSAADGDAGETERAAVTPPGGCSRYVDCSASNRAVLGYPADIAVVPSGTASGGAHVLFLDRDCHAVRVLDGDGVRTVVGPLDYTDDAPGEGHRSGAEKSAALPLGLTAPTQLLPCSMVKERSPLLFHHHPGSGGGSTAAHIGGAHVATPEPYLHTTTTMFLVASATTGVVSLLLPVPEATMERAALAHEEAAKADGGSLSDRWAATLDAMTRLGIATEGRRSMGEAGLPSLRQFVLTLHTGGEQQQQGPVLEEQLRRQAEETIATQYMRLHVPWLLPPRVVDTSSAVVRLYCHVSGPRASAAEAGRPHRTSPSSPPSSQGPSTRSNFVSPLFQTPPQSRAHRRASDDDQMALLTDNIADMSSIHGSRGSPAANLLLSSSRAAPNPGDSWVCPTLSSASPSPLHRHGSEEQGRPGGEGAASATNGSPWGNPHQYPNNNNNSSGCNDSYLLVDVSPPTVWDDREGTESRSRSRSTACRRSTSQRGQVEADEHGSNNGPSAAPEILQGGEDANREVEGAATSCDDATAASSAPSGSRCGRAGRTEPLLPPERTVIFPSSPEKTDHTSPPEAEDIPHPRDQQEGLQGHPSAPVDPRTAMAARGSGNALGVSKSVTPAYADQFGGLGEEARQRKLHFLLDDPPQDAAKVEGDGGVLTSPRGVGGGVISPRQQQQQRGPRRSQPLTPRALSAHRLMQPRGTPAKGSAREAASQGSARGARAGALSPRQSTDGRDRHRPAHLPPGALQEAAAMLNYDDAVAKIFTVYEFFATRTVEHRAVTTAAPSAHEPRDGRDRRGRARVAPPPIAAVETVTTYSMTYMALFRFLYHTGYLALPTTLAQAVAPPLLLTCAEGDSGEDRLLPVSPADFRAVVHALHDCGVRSHGYHALAQVTFADFRRLVLLLATWEGRVDAYAEKHRDGSGEDEKEKGEEGEKETPPLVAAQRFGLLDELPALDALPEEQIIAAYREGFQRALERVPGFRRAQRRRRRSQSRRRSPSETSTTSSASPRARSPAAATPDQSPAQGRGTSDGATPGRQRRRRAQCFITPSALASDDVLQALERNEAALRQLFDAYSRPVRVRRSATYEPPAAAAAAAAAALNASSLSSSSRGGAAAAGRRDAQTWDWGTRRRDGAASRATVPAADLEHYRQEGIAHQQKDRPRVGTSANSGGGGAATAAAAVAALCGDMTAAAPQDVCWKLKQLFATRATENAATRQTTSRMQGAMTYSQFQSLFKAVDVFPTLVGQALLQLAFVDALCDPLFPPHRRFDTAAAGGDEPSSSPARDDRAAALASLQDICQRHRMAKAHAAAPYGADEEKPTSLALIRRPKQHQQQQQQQPRSAAHRQRFDDALRDSAALTFPAFAEAFVRVALTAFSLGGEADQIAYPTAAAKLNALLLWVNKQVVLGHVRSREKVATAARPAARLARDIGGAGGGGAALRCNFPDDFALFHVPSERSQAAAERRGRRK